MLSLTRYWLILFLLAGSIHWAQAQRLEQFSADKNQFLKELEGYMSASKQKRMIELYDAAEAAIRGGQFSQEEYETINQTANLMLKQRMVANGYFTGYLSALLMVKKDQEGEERFKNWHSILIALLEDIQNRKVGPYKEFLSFSNAFFEKEALRFSKSGTSWMFATEGYQMKYADKKVSIHFEKVSIIGKRKKTEIYIYETSGVYWPLAYRWEGKGGKVNWTRHDLSEDVYCELADYTINTKKNVYESKGATFYHPDLFGDQGVAGKFADKVIVQNQATEGSYPRFESDIKILKINSFGDNLKYTGGFRLQGTTIYGYGQDDEKANLVLYGNDGKPKYRGIANLLVIKRSELIVGEQVESFVYFGQDSIYHPSVNLRLDLPAQELTLTRGDRGSDRNPFYDSFHKVNIYSDKITWHIEGDSISINEKKFNVGNGSSKVLVESVSFFDSREYRRIQNLSDKHPLAELVRYSNQTGMLRLDANEYARFLNPTWDVSNIQSLIYELVAAGFINYYQDRKQLEVKDKVFHYAAASQDKVDYDVIRLTSDAKGTNAFFDINKKAIKTGGIKVLELSAKQKVAAKPINNQIILKQNRNIDFDGKLYAGYSTFLGKEFAFDYDRFHIGMDSIRYFDLFLMTDKLDKRGDPIAESIASRIEHASGILLIDAPGNKSGKEEIAMFPSFESKEASYVYYDRKETQGGCYFRDSFYFKLDAFSFPSLDRFNREALHFKGTMVSATIFPDFKETLLLQEEDYSLGFITQSPAEGWSNYLGKGQFKGEVSLSNKGFLARGNISHLWASIDSEDIIYRPKQMFCSAEGFDLEEDRSTDIQVPQVSGEDVRINWRPYKDSMYVYSQEKSFRLFKEDRHTLEGSLVLTPDGLKGQGIFDWDEGTLSSPLVSLGAFSALADTADVKIKAFEGDNFAFDTKNVQAKVDFDEQTGWFKANNPNQITTMPYNQYQTTMNEFSWDMKEQTVTFKSEEGRYGIFTSIHPDQDSLRFQGKTAFYDMKTSELRLGGVPQIPTADAYVIPDSFAVDIRPGGIMTTLKNAQIIANTSNQYHIINRATVDVIGGKEYKATGFYEYNVGPHQQEIEFTNIIGSPFGKGRRSQKPLLTRAAGEVVAADQFYMDTKTEFRGQITLRADEQNLLFEGFARLDSKTLLKRDWFSINCRGDRNDLVVTFDEPKTFEGAPVRNGLFLSKETGKLYPAIMTPLQFRKDRAILDARGAFRYDDQADAFIFGDSLRITNNAIVGSYLKYGNKDAGILAKGQFNIGSGLDNVKVKAVGQMQTALGGIRLPDGKLSTDKTTIDLIAGIDVYVPEKLLKIMVIDIKSSSFDAAGIPYSKTDFYKEALAHFIPTSNELNAIVTNMSATRSIDMPEKGPKHTFFVTELPMLWDADYQSFLSKGSAIGLHSITGEKIDKKLTGYVEFKMPSNEDDRWYFFIKAPNDNYYYFGYKQGVLSMVSNNPTFTEVLEGIKEKDRIVKLKEGNSIELQPTTHSVAMSFVKRVQAAQRVNK
ncbi:MAG: hypothetical protein AAFO94_01880 [Bacteroidota bacterium]